MVRGIQVGVDRLATRSEGGVDSDDPCQKILDETIAALYSGDPWYWTENIAGGNPGAHFGHAHQFHFSAEEFLEDGEEPDVDDEEYRSSEDWQHLFRVMLHEARHHTLNHIVDSPQNHAIAQAAEMCAAPE